MIQIADLRTFKKFQQTFAMKCSFCKFAVYQSVTLGKLYFVADDFLSIFFEIFQSIFSSEKSWKTAVVKEQFMKNFHFCLC